MPDQPDEEVAPDVCPECGSPELLRTARWPLFAVFTAAIIGVGAALDLSAAAFLLVLAAGIFVLVSGRTRCTECGESWN